MLAEFIESLPSQFPEARLDMAKPVEDASDALARLETLCQHYSEIANCADDLAAEEAYMAYVNGFSDALGADPDKAKQLFESGISSGVIAGGATLALLATEGAIHSADAASLAADTAAHGLDMLDAGEAAATLGVSVLLSLGVRWYIKRRNDAKSQEVERLTERACLRGRLAKALMTPGKMEMVQDALRRLRQGTFVADSSEG